MSIRRIGLERENRSWKGVIALVWLLFVALPAIGLRSAVTAWLDDEEKGMRAAARKQLIEEMHQFKAEIDPAKSLEHILDGVVRGQGFGDGIPASVAAKLAGYGQTEFDRLCDDLVRRIGIRPAVSALVIPSNGRILVRAEPSLFPGRRIDDVEKEVVAILKLLLIYPGAGEKTADAYEPAKALSYDQSEALFGGDFHLANPARGVRKDVAHFCGTANVYTAIDWASTEPAMRQFSAQKCSALFMNLFHERSIVLRPLLKSPLSRSVFPLVRRGISGVRGGDLPKFVSRPGFLAFLQAPPLEWSDEDLWRGGGISPRRGLRPVFAVTAAPSLLRHPWRDRLPWFDIGLLLAVGGTALLGLRMALFGYSVGSGLRSRVAWGFAFGSMIPCCGFAMMATASAKAGENRSPQAVLAHLSCQLQRLDDGLNTARTVRAKSLQTWASRIVSRTGPGAAIPPNGVIAAYLRKIVDRGLVRTVLAFTADGRDLGETDYDVRSAYAPLQKLMKCFSQDTLIRLGGRGGDEGPHGGGLESTIDLVHAITWEYMDESYIRGLHANTPLLFRNPFGDFSQFMSVQIAPPAAPGVRPAIVLISYGGLEPISTQYMRRLLKRAPGRLAERHSGWNIKYIIYHIRHYTPPAFSENVLGFDQHLWKKYRTLADVSLRRRMGRLYDALPEQPGTVAATRMFISGDLLGVAVAVPDGQPRGPGWKGVAAAIVCAWSVVTLATALFLTLPFPVFLEATRRTARGEYDWRLSLDRPDEFGDLATVFNGMARGLWERAGMARFVSDGVLSAVRKADAGAANLAAGGERLAAAVLTSDIRGFTTLSETNAPEDVVTLLNDYFTLMEEPIKAAGGTIETYLGDAIVAVFPPDPAGEAPELRAVSAARNMREALARFNEARRRDGRFTIETGIGVAAGTILWGRLGGDDGRLLPTLIGSPADRASRCEAATKGKGGSGIIVDETVWNALGGRFPGTTVPADGEKFTLLS